MIDAELLNIVACPYCVTRPEKTKSTLARGDLEIVGPAQAPTGLKCKDCGREYRISDGLPNFLIDEAILPEKKDSAAR